MKAAALAYATRFGWHVFPVAADGRTPIKGHGFEHGYLSATADPTEIEGRWTLHPNANIALACGASSVFALDVDVKAADGRTTLAELEDEFGQLPETPTAITPSGGLHILFRAARVLPSPVGFRPGLDARATRASICLAPSRRPDGRYRWTLPPSALPLADAPEWLLAMVDPPEPPRPPRKPLRLDARGRTVRYVEAALDDEAKAVATAGAGGRNDRLFQAAANLGELVGAGLLPEDLATDELERAAQENGLWREDPHGCRATIKSGLRRGILHPREVRA